MSITVTQSNALRNLERNLRNFTKRHERAMNRAVQTATTRSRAQFQSRLSGRPHVPARPGRPTTGGNFGRMIKWQRERLGKHEYVAFQEEDLAARAPYWLIQEIGTGQSAMITDIQTPVSVRSQRGRRISPSLTFADAQGNYAPPQPGRQDQQIRSLSDVKMAPFRADLDAIVIKREIEGKHFIRDGGHQANDQYRSTLLSLARDTFRKSQ